MHVYKQLYSRYAFIAFRENGHVSTETQFILNTFQVNKILHIQIDIKEKKEITVPTETRIFILAYQKKKIPDFTLV